MTYPSGGRVKVTECDEGSGMHTAHSGTCRREFSV